MTPETVGAAAEVPLKARIGCIDRLVGDLLSAAVVAVGSSDVGGKDVQVADTAIAWSTEAGE